MTAFDAIEEDFSISYRLVTAVQDQKHIQLLAWTHTSNEANLDRWLPQIIDGLDVQESAPEMIEYADGVIKDHRLGFQLAYPEEWNYEVASIPGLEAVSNMIMLLKGEVGCAAMAVYVPHGQFVEDRVIEVMMANKIFNISPSSRREEASTLAGLPARKLSFVSQDGFTSFTAWIARRGNTLYFFQMNTPASQAADMERLRDFFSLLD